MKEKFLYFFLALLFYTYGVLTIWLNIFPFDQIQYVKKLFVPSNAYLHRDLDTKNLTEISSIDIKKPMVFVTYGQSNSLNYGQIGYKNSENVYMFLDGKTFHYKEPALGGQGGNGSVWGRVGDQLVRSGYAQSVIFIMAGWGSASIHQLTYDYQFEFFQNQMRNALNKFGKIDGILFHQGESNVQRLNGSDKYKEDFINLLSKIRGVTNAPIYLSLASICHGGSDQTLLKIQDQLIIEKFGVLRGPNSDILSDPKYRLPDYCHFSKLGLDELSTMWVKSIINKSEM